MSVRLSPTQSLTRLASVLWVSAFIALVAGTALVWVGFRSLLDSRDKLLSRIEPALVESQRLRASLLDQETGVRAYATTRDTRLLQPFEAGVAAQNAVQEELKRLLDDDAVGRDLLTEVDSVNSEMDEWRRTVAGLILVDDVQPDELDVFTLKSKVAFDEVRATLDRLEAGILAERANATRELDQATTRLVLAISAAIGLLGLMSIAGGWVLRRRVVWPIAQVSEAAAAVVGDQLDQPIDVVGPIEIERLAQQVSQMRDRIVGELAAVEAGRLELDRRATDLARSNADLEQFAYVASHDLQEPLRKVASFCQLIEQRYDDQLDDRGRTYIAFAVDGAKRMQAQITDLLEFSRVGRTTTQFVSCDLEQIAHEAAAAVTADDDEVDDGWLEIGDLPTLAGDPILYRVLFQNVIGNALKYRRPDVPVRMRITAEHADQTWTFRCADNGIGIEPAYRERVFVIFQRLHARDVYAGTGIGLALCKRIVEFVGGRIWVGDGLDGSGTSVCWTLPDAPVLAPPDSTPPRQDGTA